MHCTVRGQRRRSGRRRAKAAKLARARPSRSRGAAAPMRPRAADDQKATRPCVRSGAPAPPAAARRRATRQNRAVRADTSGPTRRADGLGT
eukprot:6213477-Pleurochrysis_carterae.AAC.6